ncbi:hypothetical protein V6N13_144496 [Hibiscus sabdariffa]
MLYRLFHNKQLFVICYISYLVAATGLQSLRSLSQAIVDVYALLVRRSLQDNCVLSLSAIGDGVRYLIFAFTNEEALALVKSSVRYLFYLPAVIQSFLRMP